MQTFLPYPDFVASAEVLDYRRLGKQVTECRQILDALHEVTKGWVNHPVTHMWKGSELALCGFAYACEDEWEKRGFKKRADVPYLDKHFEWASSGDVQMDKPWWFGDLEVHENYQRLLFYKDPEYYGQYFGELEPLKQFPYPTR
jgi:hypothetical protein